MIDVSDLPPTIASYALDEEDLECIRVIGTGAYGEVWFGKHKPTGRDVAIKKLHSQALTERGRELFRREITALATLQHPFLLKFVGFTYKKECTLVTKYIPNDSLYNALHGDPKGLNLTPTELNVIAFGIASGMAYLHRHKTIHRDLKTQNVLIDQRHLPIICDFGSSKESKFQTQTGTAGTPHYMAPEFLQNAKCDEKIDVYSYGILLWEIVTQDFPFGGLAAAQVLCLVVIEGMRPPIPEDTDPKIAELIEKCWDKDPDVRPPFSKIVKLFQTGEVCIEGTDKKKFQESIYQFIAESTSRQHGGAVQRTKRSDFSRNHLRHGSVSVFQSGERPLKLISEQNKSTTLLIPKIKVPIHHLRQTANAYLLSINNGSTNQIQNAILFFDNNAESSALANVPLWGPLLQVLVHDPNNTQLLELLLKLAQRADVLSNISKVVDVHKYVCPQTLDFFLFIITYHPEKVDVEVVNKLIKIVNDPPHADKSIILLCKILSIHNISPLITNLIISSFQERISQFAERVGGDHILLSLLFHDKLSPEVIPLYASSVVKKNSIAAYKALFRLNGVPRGFKLENVCDHIKSDFVPLRKLALEFVRRYETKAEALPQLVDALIESFAGRGDDAALLLLCRIAADPSGGRVLTWNGIIEKWMGSTNPAFLKVFILLLRHKGFSAKFEKLIITPPFFSNVLKSRDLEIAAAAVQILGQMEIGNEFIILLQKSGGLESFFLLLQSTSEEKLIKRAPPLVEAVSKASVFDESMNGSVTHLIQLIGERHPATEEIVRILAALSRIPQTHSAFIEANAVAAFARAGASGETEMKAYVQQIFENLRSGSLNLSYL